jgi:hypothetical protein
VPARDRVEQHDDVAAHLDEPLDAVEHELGDLHVVLGGLVEGRGDDLALDRALHVGDLLGSLVDEQHDEVDVGVVGGDRVGELLEDRRLARLRRRDDEPALALADRAQQVHDARRRIVIGSLEAQTLFGEERRQLLEEGPTTRRFGVDAVDGVDLEQCAVLLVVFGLPYLAFDLVAAPQAEAPDLRERDVDVAIALRVAARAQEPEPVGEHVEDAVARDRRALRPLLALLALAAAALIAPVLAPAASRGACRDGPAGPRPSLRRAPGRPGWAEAIRSLRLLGGLGRRSWQRRRLWPLAGLGRRLRRLLRPGRTRRPLRHPSQARPSPSWRPARPSPSGGLRRRLVRLGLGRRGGLLGLGLGRRRRTRVRSRWRSALSGLRSCPHSFADPVSPLRGARSDRSATPPRPTRMPGLGTPWVT